MTVKVFVTKENRMSMVDALRNRVKGNDLQGFDFDSLEYTANGRVALLRANGQRFHIPTANILAAYYPVEES